MKVSYKKLLAAILILNSFMAIAGAGKSSKGDNQTIVPSNNTNINNNKGTTSLNYTILEYPGMAYTNAFDIYGSTIVGQTNDAGFVANHGFIYDGSTYTLVDYPGADRTWVTGIDAQGSGGLAGYYLYGSTYYGFYSQGENYYSLTYPGATRTYASDVYGSTVVGYYYNGTANFGFTYDISTSTYTSLDPPNSSLTEIQGIYGDYIVGQYRHGYNGPYYGFIYTISTNSWTIKDNPEQASQGITFNNVDATHVVGYYTIPIEVQKSFYYEISTGTFTLIDDYSGAVHTFAYGIEGTGTIVGYVENSGSQKGFRVPVPPVVTTQAVSNIGGITATGNGNITNLGITNVVAHGVCWNTSGSPTLSDDHTNKGAAGSTGAFTSNMTGLSGTTTYYVKAYATASNGATAYGAEVSFSTTEAWVLNMYDTGGDGWNGGILNLYVDGVLSLSKTMENGYGPDSYPFEAICGQVITTFYYPGNYSYENEYTLVNPSGTTVVESGQGGTIPGNITYSYFCGTAGTVTTQDASDVSYTTATGNGNITELGTNNPTHHGFCWNTSGTPTISNSHTDEGAATSTGAFTSSITGLSANTLYYIRAYIYDNMGYSYGDEVTFSTLAYVAGTVSTQDVTNILQTTATGNGNVTSIGTVNPTQHGVCWKTSTGPTIANSHTSQGAVTETGAFTSSMTSLAANTTYYVRAYITDITGTIYGDEVTFSTLANVPGTVSTQDATNITQTTATGNGNVTSLGTVNPTQHGVCWKTSSGPTISDSHTSDGAVSSTGAFTSSMTGLTANTTYYVRAYITDVTGTIYGDEVSFSTLANEPGTVSTEPVTNLSAVSVTANGSVGSLSPSGTTSKGFCWNSSPDVSTLNSKAGLGTASVGSFSYNITGLLPNTTYYLRAYIIDITGTTYGDEVSFTTSSAIFSGNGNFDLPFEIANLDDLENLSTNSDYWSGYFIQTANINATETSEWNPDGNGGYYGFSPIGNTTKNFAGNYNGQGYTISNLYINRSATDNIGLFGYLRFGTVKNLSLDNMTITGKSNVGGTVAYSYGGTISNVSVNVNITATGNYCGGLIGQLYSGTISDNQVVGTVTGIGYAGGFVGYINSTSTISRCYTTATVNSSGNWIGGFGGYVRNATIENCYSRGDVTHLGGTSTATGSFSGYNSSTIRYCYCTGKVVYDGATAPTDKGFVAYNSSGTYTSNFFDSETSLQSSGTGATGKTTLQMKTESTFTNASWDFVSVWNMDGTTNNGYAFLNSLERIWTGAASTVWGTAANWDESILPLSYNNIRIPIVANQPVIESGVGVTCNDLKVDAGATLTVESGGSLITSGAITNNSNIHLKRTLAEETWHLISVPNRVTTANIFLGDFLQSWDETTYRWTQITDPATELNPLLGYSLWATPVKSNSTYTFTGTPVSGNQNQPITVNGTGGEYNGANLLGNPYPSAIDWNGLRTYGAVYYWDGTAYLSWNSSGSGSRYIAPMQGFFIVATTSILSTKSSLFSLTNSNRTHTGATAYYKSGDDNPLSNGLVLQASNGSYNDELWIILNDTTNESYDLMSDAWKLKTSTPGISQLWSVCPDGNLSIDVRPATDVIQLGFANDKAGTYTIGIKEIADLNTAILEDTKTGTFQDLNKGSYEFVWGLNDDEKRFKLHLNAVGIEETPINESNLLIYAANGQIFIKGAEAGQLKVCDLMGRVVLQKEISGNGIISVPVNLQTGVYLVSVQNGQKIKTEKVIIK